MKAANALWMLAIACRPATDDPGTWLTPIEATAPVSTFVQSTSGAAPLDVRVLARNGLGVRAPGASAALDVDGVTEPLTFDGYGLAVSTVFEPGNHTVQIADGAPYEVWATARPWGGLALDPTSPKLAGAEDLWSFPHGVAFVRAGELWWWTANRDPEPVLAADNPVNGVIQATLNADLLPDLIVWDDRRILLLQGTPDGSYAWGTGFDAGANTLGGVAAHDVDQDGVDDLWFGLHRSDPTAADRPDSVELWRNKGALGFEPYDRLLTAIRPASIAAVDAAEGAGAAVELVGARGDYLRFRRDPEGSWVMTDEQAVVALQPGGTLFNAGDFDGDGVDDVFALGPRLAGEDRQIVYVNRRGMPLRFVEIEVASASAVFADANDDGATELWTLDEAGAVTVTSTVAGEQVVWTVSRRPEATGLAVVDRDGDGVVDLVTTSTAGEVVQWGATDPDAPWRPRDLAVDNLLEDVLVAGPLRGVAGEVRWAGAQRRDGELWAKAWSREEGGEALVERGRQRVTPYASTVSSTALCGDQLWAIAEERLWRVPFTSAAGDDDPRPSPPLEVAGFSHGVVACQADGWGAVLADGTITLFSPDGARSEPASANGATALALSRGDAPRVLTCAEDGCAVAWWRIGSVDVPVTSTGLGVVVGEASPLPIHGALVVGDVDGDSSDDLVVLGDESAVGVLRSTPDGPGPWAQFEAPGPLGTAGFLADRDGDGAKELFATNADSTLFVTATSPRP